MQSNQVKKQKMEIASKTQVCRSVSRNDMQNKWVHGAMSYDQALGTYISLTNFLNLAHTSSLVKLYTALNNDRLDE